MFVDLDYEQIPDYCTSCRMIGHQLNNCRKQVNNDNRNIEQGRNTNNEKGKTTEVVNLDTEVVDLDKEVPEQDPLIVENNPDASKRVQNNDTEIVDSRALSTHGEIRKDAEVEKEAPEPLIATQSRAAPIGNIETETLCYDRAQLTVQQNVDIDDSSSQDSEFVDATQINEDIITSPTPSNDQKEPTPVRIQKDIAFLNESWANLAEQTADGDIANSMKHVDEGEHSEQRRILEKEIDAALIREDEVNLQASGFQLVTHKAKNKAQKSKYTSVKNKYETRSKPSNPKPFL